MQRQQDVQVVSIFPNFDLFIFFAMLISTL